MDEVVPPSEGRAYFNKRAYLVAAVVGIAGVATAVVATRETGGTRIALWVVAGLLLVIPLWLAILTVAFIVGIWLVRGVAHALGRSRPEAPSIAALLIVASLLGILLGVGPALGGPGALAVGPAVALFAGTVWKRGRPNPMAAHRLAAALWFAAAAAAVTGAYVLFVS